jgi:predicted ABC-type ATPase
MANLYVIAGCNGAGKTTASFSVLPEMLQCKEFVNADEIAKGLSPFQPETVSLEAGRIMLKRIKELVNQNVDFAFETTLASSSYKQLIKEAQADGYLVTLVFFWLNSPELAIKRVKSRVKSGGHNIPEDVILRRYLAGIKNLGKLYLPVCDYWILIDNSEQAYSRIAEGSKTSTISVNNQMIFDKIIKND